MSRFLQVITGLVAAVTAIFLGALAPRTLRIITFKPESGGSSALRWAPAYRNPVGFHYEGETVRYHMDGEESDEEFAKLVPPTGHLIHLPIKHNDAAPYTVTLFHQLQCLDVLRREYIDSEDYPSTPEKTQHCLQYLQQSLLCRPHIGLEVTKNAAANARRSYDMVCNDWEAVYQEAAKNWEVYEEMSKDKGEQVPNPV